VPQCLIAGDISEFNPEILTVSPSWGIKQWWGGEFKLFSSFVRRNLENGTRYD